MTVKYVGIPNSEFGYGAILQINGFADADDDFGIIASARYHKRWVQVVLCDVEIEVSSPQTQALEDYIVWFVHS